MERSYLQKKLDDLIQIEYTIFSVYMDMFDLDSMDYPNKKELDECISNLKISLDVEKHFLDRWKLDSKSIEEIIRILNFDGNLLEAVSTGKGILSVFSLNDINYILNHQVEDDVFLAHPNYVSLVENSYKNPIFRRIFLKIMSRFALEDRRELSSIILYPLLTDGYNEFFSKNRIIEKELLVTGELEKQFLYNMQQGMENNSLGEDMDVCLKYLKYSLAFVNPYVESYFLTPREPSFLYQKQDVTTRSYITNVCTIYLKDLLMDSKKADNNIVLNEMIFELITYTLSLTKEKIYEVLNEVQKDGKPIHPFMDAQLNLILKTKGSKQKVLK